MDREWSSVVEIYIGNQDYSYKIDIIIKIFFLVPESSTKVEMGKGTT